MADNRRAWVCREIDGKTVFLPLDLDYRPEPVAPYVRGDSMRALEHPCDGKFYDSKSAFRAVTKAHGCVELGNDLKGKPKTHPGSKLPPGRKELLIKNYQLAKEGKLKPANVESVSSFEQDCGPINLCTTKTS